MTTIKELCETIAEALGPEWSATAPGDQNWCNYLIHANGMVLFCRKSRDRLEIQTDAIESITEEDTIIFRYNRGNPSITVSATRGPKAIAHEIRHRLLPEATAWWQRGMIEKQVAEERHAEAQKLRDKLLEFPGATTIKNPYISTDVAVKGPGHTWIANINQHNISFHSLTNEQMIALLTAYHQLDIAGELRWLSNSCRNRQEF